MALRSLLHSLYNPTIAHKFFNAKHFSSHSIALQPQQIISHPPSQYLVNELSRILSDYREPQHDLESALAPFASQVSTNLIEQVLKRCNKLGFSAQRLFLWAQKLPDFQHSKESYHILVDILGSSRKFPFLWDFLTEMKASESCEITREIFWIVFRAYSRANLPSDAIRAFNKMVDFGIKPCLDDLDQLLIALCKRKHVKHAQEFFDQVKVDGLNPSVKTYSILMRGWGDIGDCSDVRKLFDEMLERGCVADLLAWNSVLDALCKGGKADEAYELFCGMRSKEGLEPDAYSYSIFIRAYIDADDIHSAFRVLDTMKRYNRVPNVFTYNFIIKRLCKNGKIGEAYELLDEMIERGAKPDTWSYNTILAYHCDHKLNMALKLVSRMDKDVCEPERHTYNMVLKMLVRIGRFDRAEKVWLSMEKRGFYPTVSTYSVMIHGLSKKRMKLDEACRYFEMMVDEGIPPYTTTCELLSNKLIGLGFAEKADIVAEKMERSTSLAIQDAANLMRGNRAHSRPRAEEQYSDESDS